MRALGATNGAARSAVAWRLRAIGAWAVAVALGVSCSDSATAPRPRPRDPGSFVVASHAAAASEVAYVSLPPATIQNGVEARLRVGRAATTVIVPVVDGGFDPVALGAAVGDSIAIDVQASDTVLSFMLVVPRPSRPVVVRTSPPPHKRDVSLNANIVVVFSEPIDPATLTRGTVQLRKGGAAVPGPIALPAITSVISSSTSAPTSTPIGT